MAGSDATTNVHEWTVGELSAALKRTVEDAYHHVRVRGEISGYRGPHPSGHAYFSLKDENARIDAVIWRTSFARMRVRPEEGLEVIATGRLTTYPGRSSYQIVIDSLAPAGAGALMALLETRRRKLAAEGLFDESRKRPLPGLPAVIGIVTSPTGAVIRDILHRLGDRFLPHVLVWPVRVQGDGAADQIAAAIRGFNAIPADGPVPRPQLLIVARGGGSIEDLWCFNEEVVVRAAADSVIPLISAVGHETDFTLIDHAADRRAPTPSAAAEIAVPVRAEMIARIDGLARRAISTWARGQDGRRTELRAAVRALPTADEVVALPRQRLDIAGHRLPRALIANAQVHHAAFSRIAGRLSAQSLTARIVREHDRVTSLIQRVGRGTRVEGERRRDRFASASARLQAALRANAQAQRAGLGRSRERLGAMAARAAVAVDTLLDRRADRLERAAKLLTAFSYHGVLARGFALVRSEAGKPLRSAAAVDTGSRLDIEFADGRVRAKAEVRDITGPAGTRPVRRRNRQRQPDPGQGNLF